MPLTHFPPLYPAILAALGTLGFDLSDAARWMNAALFSVNLAIIGLALRCARHSRVVPLLAMLWMLLSVDLIYLHAMALSEPLCLALGFSGLAMLASSLEGDRLNASRLAIAAGLTGPWMVCRERSTPGQSTAPSGSYGTAGFTR
jgi:hypothetical protein